MYTARISGSPQASELKFSSAMSIQTVDCRLLSNPSGTATPPLLLLECQAAAAAVS